MGSIFSHASTCKKNRITLYKRNANESDKIERIAHKQTYRQTENEMLIHERLAQAF